MVTLQGQQEEAQMSKVAEGRNVTACQKELQTIQVRLGEVRQMLQLFRGIY